VHRLLIILLAAIGLTSSAYQSRQPCASSTGTGAAGRDRTLPCPAQVAPPASNPAVKAHLDYGQNLKDVERMAKLVGELKRNWTTTGKLSSRLQASRTSDEIEKLSKKVHDRIKTDYSRQVHPPGYVDGSKRQ